MITHTSTCRVIYGDTDNMGVAYYANYFRWFEMGRTELFRYMGMTYKDMEAQGFFMPVKEAHCEYHSSLHYDDVLKIEVRLEVPLKAALNFSYRVFDADTEKLVATGYTRHACVNGEGKVVRPPKFLKEFVESYIKKQSQ